MRSRDGTQAAHLNMRATSGLRQMRAHFNTASRKCQALFWQEIKPTWKGRHKKEPARLYALSLTGTAQNTSLVPLLIMRNEFARLTVLGWADGKGSHS